MQLLKSDEIQLKREGSRWVNNPARPVPRISGCSARALRHRPRTPTLPRKRSGCVKSGRWAGTGVMSRMDKKRSVPGALRHGRRHPAA